MLHVLRASEREGEAIEWFSSRNFYWWMFLLAVTLIWRSHFVGGHALFFAMNWLLHTALLVCAFELGTAQNFPPTFDPVISSVNIPEFEEEDGSELTLATHRMS